MFKALILTLALLSSQSVWAMSCKRLFSQQTNLKAAEGIEVLFPRRLHIRDHQLNFLLKESSYKELAKELGTLFAKMEQQPHFIEQIAQALVEYSNAGSQSKKVSPTELIDFFKENFNLEIKTNEAEVTTKVYEKIQQEMELGGLTLKEQHLFSFLLQGQKMTPVGEKPAFFPKEALPRQTSDLFNLKERQPRIYELYSKRIQFLLRNTHYKKTIADFNISFLDWFASHMQTNSYNTKLKEDTLQRVTKLTKSKMHKGIAQITISHLLDVVNIVLEGGTVINITPVHAKPRNLTREETLNGIEELVLSKILDFKPERPMVADHLIKVIDYILFNPPSAKKGPDLRSAVIEKAGNLLLPAKAELSKLKTENTLKENQKNSISGMDFIFKSESPNEALPPQTPSGRKRKHNKKKTPRKETAELKKNQSQELEIDPKVDLSFWVKSSEKFQTRPIEEINSTETYQFFFARDTGRGLQKIKFEDKVLEAFADRPKTAVQLIKAIVYGPTSRNSSSAGIKSQAVKSKGDISFYEARPAGTSANNEGAWRLLLSYDKTTQVWTAQELVSKNMMNKVLLSQ